MDPASITAIVGAVIAGILSGVKGKEVVQSRRAQQSDYVPEHANADQWERRLDQLQGSLRSDHAALAAKVDTVHDDIQVLKTDIAVIKERVNANHQYISERVNRLENK